MGYFIFAFTIYLISIGVNAWFIHYKDRSHKVWLIAFDMWKSTLHVKGYPKHESGAWMTYWELADYFDNSEIKKSYINHVENNWLKETKNYKNKQLN